MRHGSRSMVGVGLAAWLIAPPAIAQPLDVNDPAYQAFARAWQATLDSQPPSGWVFKWRREAFASMSLSELEAMEAQLAQTPAHPDWQRLRHQRHLIEAGPDVTEYEVWWSGPGALRYNGSYPTSQVVPYIDFVVTPGAVFCLNPEQLTVLEPGVAPPEGRDFYVYEGDALWALALLSEGGLGAPRYKDATIQQVRIEGGLVIASLAHNANRVEFITDSLGDEAQPHVRSIAYFMADRPDSPAQSYRFRPRQPDPAFGSGVHPIVEKFGPAGQLVERLTWVGSRPMERGEFERVTAIPALDGSDPVRGPAKFTSVFDYRSGEITQAASLGTVPMAIPNYVPPEGSLTWLRPAGWIAAAILVASFIGLRIWRSSRSRHNSKEIAS